MIKTPLGWKILQNVKLNGNNQLYRIYTNNGYKYNDYLRLEEATILVSQAVA